LQDKTELTIHAYNENFSNFNSKFMNYGPYSKQVAEFANYLDDGFKILDIGCGPGNVAKQLCSLKQLNYTGIDLSFNMVDVAKRNVPSGVFTVQDSRTAHFPTEYFNAIILSFSIVHLEDEEAKVVLKNAIRWLQNGGYIYLSFMEGKKAGFETTSFSLQPIYFNYFYEDEIKKILKEFGIDCLRSVRQDYLEPDGSNTTDIFLFGRK